jgi:hypothetical protein
MAGRCSDAGARNLIGSDADEERREVASGIGTRAFLARDITGTCNLIGERAPRRTPSDLFQRYSAMSR